MLIRDYIEAILKSVIFVSPLLVLFLFINYFMFKNDLLTSLKNTLVILAFALCVIVAMIIAVELSSRWYGLIDKKVSGWFGGSG